MRLLVTRPSPGAETLAGELERLGYEPVMEPLLEVEFLDPGPLPLSGAQALIVTSANALRALGKLEQRGEAARLPLYAVGAATARAARGLGFREVREGGGNAGTLLPLIVSDCAPDAGPLIHLAGERLAVDLGGELGKQGFTVMQPVLYRARPAKSLSAEVCQEITSGTLAGVILMSPATARTYAHLIEKSGLAKEVARFTHFCLSPNTAAGLASLAGTRIVVADTPSRDGLLALIARETANC